MPNPATLIIPVENQVRELDAKLLLGCVAAERGFPVVLGSRYFVHFMLPDLPPGVVVAKSMRAVSRATLLLTRHLGHRIVAWDEEGLVRYSAREYYDWRYSRDAFRVVDRLFTWGQDDADLFAGYVGYHGAPIHVSGNPRIDLLRPELRAYFREQSEALRREHGAFVLINTNFSFVNAFVPELNLMHPGADRPSRTGAGLEIAFARDMAAHQQAIHDAFRNLMPRLSQWFPDHRIIVRPHPSENHDTWRAATAGLPNVRVLHDGNVVPWLIACGALLHNGCTTAVEAAVLGRAAVSYRPVTSPRFDYPLPNSLSDEAFTAEAVNDALARALAGKVSGGPARQRLLERHLAALDGPLASDRVVDVLEHAGYLDGLPATHEPARALLGWTGLKLRAVIQRLSACRPGSRHGSAHHEHRFPAISAASLNDRVARLGASLGRFAGLRVRSRSPHIFTIETAPHAEQRIGRKDTCREVMTDAGDYIPGRAARARVAHNVDRASPGH